MSRRKSRIENAAMKAAYAPTSSGIAAMMRDPYFMAEQPLSPACAAYLLSNHQRQLTEAENRDLSQPPAGTEQVVLMLKFPNGGLEHGVGLAPLGSLQNTKIRFKKVDPRTQKVQEYSREFKSEIFFPLQRFCSLLAAIAGGHVEEKAETAAAYEAARQDLDRMQYDFSEEHKSVNEIFGQHGDGCKLYMQAIESIYTKTGDDIDHYNFVTIFRGTDVLNGLRDCGKRAFDLMGIRYVEEKSYVHNVGHDSSMAPPEQVENGNHNNGNKKQGANNQQAAADEAQTTLDDYGWLGAAPDAHTAAAGNMIGANLDDEQKIARAFYLKNGHDWATTPASRKRTLGAILSEWENSLAILVKPYFAERGLGLSDMKQFFSYIWQGDVFEYCHPSALQNRVYALEPPAHKIYNGCKLSESGQYYQKFAEMDYKRLGEYSEVTHKVDGFQPAFLFAPNLCNWANGNADSTQLFIGNYFAIPNYTSRKIYGRPDQDIASLIDEAIDKSQFALRYAGEGKMTLDSAQNMLLSPYSRDPVTMGGIFKGFPYPERVQVLSPMSTMPHRLPLIILPSPPDTPHLNREYLYNRLKRAVRYVMPSSAEDKATLAVEHVQCVLFGTKSEVNGMLANTDVVTILSENNLLAELFSARNTMRYLMATSTGMIKEWGLRMDHQQLSDYGNATLQQGGVAHSMPHPNSDWGVLSAEPDSVNEDVPDRRKWDDFMSKIQECMGERDAHLRRCLSATRSIIEVCQFTKKVRELSDILPWKTMDKIVAATNKKMRESVNESIYTSVFRPPNFASGSSESEHEIRAWSHRRISQVSNEFSYSRKDKSGSTHKTWKMVGPFSDVDQADIDVLRREEFISDFIGDYHRQHDLFVTNMLKPLEMYSCWASKTPRSQMPIAVEKLRDMVLIAHTNVSKLCHLFKQNNSRLFFIRVPKDDLKTSAYHDSPVLPPAYKSAFYHWTHHLGRVDTLSKIDVTDMMDKWANLDASHAILLARKSTAAMKLGIGLNGSSSMLGVFHQGCAAFNSSCVMSKDKAKLQHFDLIVSAETATGKSYLMAVMMLTQVPGTYEIISSISPQAWNVRQVFDGMSVYFDEGNIELTSGGPNKNQQMIDLLKMIMTTGFCHRDLCEYDNEGDRVGTKIYASHRRSFCMSMNYTVAFMDKALKGRFMIKNLRSTSSDEKQPLEHSIHARVSQTSAFDELRRLATQTEIMTEFQSQHACKIIIESCIQQGLMNVNVESITDAVIQTFGPQKSKMDHDGKLARVYSTVPLIMRSYITDLAAWMLNALFVSQQQEGRYQNVDFMPFEFIVQNAQRFLYSTTGMLVYACTILFQDKIDNPSHVDIAMGILKHQGVQLAVDRSVYVTVPLLQTQAAPDRLNNPELAKKMDELASAPHVIWSDDDQIRVRGSHIPKNAIDMNYTVWNPGARTYGMLIKNLSAIMPPGRGYGEQQIRTALDELKERSFNVSEETDFNIKHARFYEAAIVETAKKKAESNRSLRDFSQRISEMSGDPEANPHVLEISKRASKVLKDMSSGGNGDGHGRDDSSDKPIFGKKFQMENLSDPAGYNTEKDENHREPAVPMVSISDAANMNLPLMRHNYGTKLPIVKIVNSGSKGQTSICLALSRHFLEEVQMLYDVDNEKVDLPITSILVNTLKDSLNKMAPYPMYPRPVMREMDPKLRKEVILTTYDLSASSSHVAGRVKDACDFIKQAVLQRGQTLHPDLLRVVDDLPGRLLRESMSLSAHAPITVEFKDLIEPIVMVNQSKASPVAQTRDKLSILLSYSRLPSFSTPAFLNGPACDPERLLDPQNVLDRYAAAIVDSNRLWYSVKQENRLLTHGLDWESLRQHCVGSRPIADPLDPLNYRTLPLLSVKQQVIARNNRFIDKSQPTPPMSSEVYPISDIQHQLKTRVYNIFFKAFPHCSEALQNADPTDHGMTLFPMWLEIIVSGINESVERERAAYYGYELDPNLSSSGGAKKRSHSELTTSSESSDSKRRKQNVPMPMYTDDVDEQEQGDSDAMSVDDPPVVPAQKVFRQTTSFIRDMLH
mgnify:CR=1 FL=1